MRILALDLETSPNLAHVWGLWQQNVGLSQLRETSEILCFGARWLGERDVIFRSVHHDGKQAMLEEAHRLLSDCDAVMGWNSKGFDSKILKRELLLAGMTPPSPYKELDLMLAVKSQFRFASNKLDHVASQLHVGSKVKHEGHELWIKCMAGDDKAWERMRRYQVQDVNLLIKLHAKLRPWIPNHPNVALYDGKPDGCVSCGSNKLQRRGTAVTGTGIYPRLQCMNCGRWNRGAKRISTSEFRPAELS